MGTKDCSGLHDLGRSTHWNIGMGTKDCSELHDLGRSAHWNINDLSWSLWELGCAVFEGALAVAIIDGSCLMMLRDL